MKTIHHPIVRYLAAGFLYVAGVPAIAADSVPPVNADDLPRVVGGSSAVGGSQNIAVIPYAEPEIPKDAKVGRTTPWGHPDFSGLYQHRARLFQNPAPTQGVAPGLATAPSPLTLHPTIVTDRLGSRGDYHTPILRPWAADLVKRLGDAESAGMPYFERCLPDDGLLITWSLDPAANRTTTVLQTPDRVFFFFGHDVARIIHLADTHPPNLVPSVDGHSIGRWEGDTLVVDTIGFDGTPEADRYGTPTSDQLHVVERMHLRQGDMVLEIAFWVDDPAVYTQPWTSVTTYSRTDRLGREYVCAETLMFPSPY